MNVDNMGYVVCSKLDDDNVDMCYAFIWAANGRSGLGPMESPYISYLGPTWDP